MEIKGTQSRPSIFPALHWFIYITEICHWRNIHKLRPNQTCLKDWRGISQRGAECLFDWSVNFSCTKIPRMVWPTLIYVLFWIGRIFIWGGSQKIWLPCWLDFQALRFHCQGSIELSFRTTSTALAPLSARWEAESERLAFSSSAFKANPQLGSAEGFHSHPDWGKYAGHSVSNFWFPREGTANPPACCCSDERETNAEWGVEVTGVVQMSLPWVGVWWATYGMEQREKESQARNCDVIIET